MKRPDANTKTSAGPALTTDLLLLPDGRILVHNMTPAIAALLSEFDPNDEQMQRRVRATELKPGAATGTNH